MTIPMRGVASAAVASIVSGGVYGVHHNCECRQNERHSDGQRPPNTDVRRSHCPREGSAPGVSNRGRVTHYSYTFGPLLTTQPDPGWSMEMQAAPLEASPGVRDDAYGG